MSSTHNANNSNGPVFLFISVANCDNTFCALSDLSVNMADVETRQRFNVAKVYVFKVYVFVKGCYFYVCLEQTFFLIGEVLFMCCQSIPFGLQIIHMIKAVCAPMEAICVLYLVLFMVFSIFSELCSSKQYCRYSK